MARDYHLTQTGEETQEAINKILALDIATTDTPGLMSGEDKAILDALPSEVSDKANRASDATNGHLASLDASGNLVDSGKSVYDFATKEQGTLADSAYQKPENGIPASDMAPGVIPDVSDVVRTSVQSLSDGDKSQARENIGAASEGALEGKVDKVEGKGLSTNDYTDEDKSRVAYLPTALAGLGDAIRAKYTKPSTGIPASDIEDGVIPDVSNFITKSVDDLVNYYLKSETYTKDEVAALIGAIQQFHYEIYASRQDVVSPANNVLYLIGPTGSGTDKYEEYVYDSTKQEPWVKIGDTSIDLSGYVTTQALNTALAAYTTSADLTTLLAGKQDTISDLATIRSGAAAGATAYQKPTNGIPNSDLEGKFAGSPTAGGFANKTVAIPFGSVDASSTATALTATVDNFPTTLTDGVCAYIRNDAVASASGFTLNINGTGALPVYQTMADATRSTTVFAATTTYLFVYNSSRVEGGCWDIYYGYNSNDNTIGYNLRTNGASTPPAASKFYRYRLLFLSPDGQSLVPSNTSSSTSTTAAKTVNQAKIDPFAPIWYYSTTTAINAGSSASASYLWMQYNGIALGYSFNRVGVALTMTARDPVYLKCAPQSDGSAIMDADTPIVQSLPTTADGKIYIYLGFAESETAITMYYWHPVYYYKDGAIRLWTNAAAASITVDQTYDGTSANAQSGVAMAGALAGKQDTIDASHKLDYGLLSNTPMIPAAQVNSDWNAGSGVAQILNKPNLATVATSGSYDDLSNKPVVDATPTANSNNLVKSGGVKAYVDGKTGDLTDLDTTDKSSLVAAINEAAASGGGPGEFRLLATIDCSTLSAGDSFTITDAGGLTEVLFIFERMIGTTSSQSGFQLNEYNDLSRLFYGQVIVYSPSSNANGLSGWARVWYDGFLHYERTTGANSPTNYAASSSVTPYNVHADTFGHGKITKLRLWSNNTYPVASGIIKVYGR